MENYNQTIYLKNLYFEKLSGIELKIMANFILFINHQITRYTSLSYFKLKNDKSGNLIIPVEKLENNDNESIDELVNRKINELKKFLEVDINYNNIVTLEKLIVSALITFDFDFNKIFAIYTSDSEKQIPVKLKKPNFEKVEYKIFDIDGIDILDIYSPYVDDSLILLDSSRPFEEMGFEYNALHLFEHFLTIPFVKPTKTAYDVISSNGFTSSTAQMAVYVILKNKKSYDYYLNELCKFLKEIRDISFWDENNEFLKLEIQRTISETKQDQSLTNFAKSPKSSYDLKINKNIFHYWANQPMKLTLIHPFRTQKFPVDSFGELQEVPKPKIQKFNYMPYQILVEKSNDVKITKKVKPEKTSKKLLHAVESDDYSKLKGFYGIDIQLTFTDKFIAENIGKPDPLLIISTFRDYYDKEDFKKVLVYFLSIYHSNTYFFNK